MFKILARNNGLHKHQKIFPKTRKNRLLSTQPGQSKGGSALKYVLPITIGTLGAGAGIVGIASISDEYRKNVELALPGSSYLIEAVLGLPEKPQPQKQSKVDQGLLKKKLEREKTKQVEPTPSLKKDTDKASPANVPTSPTGSPPVSPAASGPKDNKQEPSTPVKKSEPETSNLDNVGLTQQLEDCIVSAQKIVTAALTSAEDASNAVREHANQVFAAIDTEEDNEALFETAAKIGNIKKELVNSANEQLNKAKSEIERLQNQIEHGKKSVLAEENKTLPIAEAALSELNYAINKINATLLEAHQNSTAVANYKTQVDKGWTQFYKEIQAIIPDAKVGDTSNDLSREELFMLLIHAHRKVSSLQRTLAKLETVEKDKLRESIKSNHQLQGTQVSDSRLQSELEIQRRELGLEHRHRLTQLKEEMEIELRTQLKRQAAAHSDHLADVTTAKEIELELKWSNKLMDEVQAVRDNYLKSMAALKGEVGGIKKAVESRAEVDKAAQASHLLWMACESLQTALRLGNENANSWEDKLVPLKERVNAIKKVIDNKDPFVEVVLNALPEEVLNRGVYTEDALKERFLKVERVCSRVALVGDNGGSILRYVLSYMQSFMLVNAFEPLPNSEILDKPIDVDQLTTHDILARTRYCLVKDDLLQAVKYMNLLSGEPRHAASDWIKEAKLSLEAKQAAEALMSYATATGAKAL